MKPTVIVGLAVIVVGAVVYFQIKPAQVIPPVAVSEEVTPPVTATPEEVVAEPVEESVETAEEPTVVETIEEAAEDVVDGAVEEITEQVENGLEALSEGSATVSEIVEETHETVTETLQDTVEQAAEAVTDTAQETIEEATEALGVGSVAETVANVLTPEGFDADKILEMINASDLGALQKTALNTAVTQARDNPELVQIALDQVKAALGL
ncbi:hypothetical protein [Epibacterium ulvae]|uniref:hypothetical protein n=1 Tax=Epibacterium ulvae TaxID=1156985 RepID=UPI002492F6C1|nr:hypothetical protein [Epibacterium ulvae]